MGKLSQHNTGIPISSGSEAVPSATTQSKDSGGKHHSEPSVSRSKSSGGGLPDGTLDTRRSPNI